MQSSRITIMQHSCQILAVGDSRAPEPENSRNIDLGGKNWRVKKRTPKHQIWFKNHIWCFSGIGFRTWIRSKEAIW